MADEAREEASGKGAAGCGCRSPHEAVYPKVTFSTFILSLASAGLAHLGELVAGTPSAANVRRYAEVVRDKRLLRDLLAADTVQVQPMLP